MTRAQRINRLALAGLAGAGITLASTVVGYNFGAKHGHPWLGALGGFFVLAPCGTYPVTLVIAGEALAEIAEEQRAERLQRTPAAPTVR